jgi:uncharacterized protein
MMRVSRFFCIAAVLAFSAPAFADAPPDPKLDLAVRLVNESGAAAQIAAAVDRSLEENVVERKKDHPEIPQRFWDSFRSEFHEYYRAHEDELVQQVAHIYASRLSEAELQAAIAFYETGAGKKLADSAIPDDVASVVGAWGNEAADAVGARVTNNMQGGGMH